MGIEARDVLRSEGYAIEWHEYPMAHGVCGEEIEEVARRFEAIVRSGISRYDEDKIF